MANLKSTDLRPELAYVNNGKSQKEYRSKGLKLIETSVEALIADIHEDIRIAKLILQREEYAALTDKIKP
jgi:hypothetical protein